MREGVAGVVLLLSYEGFCPGLSDWVLLVAKRCLDWTRGIIQLSPFVDCQSLSGLGVLANGRGSVRLGEVAPESIPIPPWIPKNFPRVDDALGGWNEDMGVQGTRAPERFALIEANYSAIQARLPELLATHFHYNVLQEPQNNGDH